MSELYTDRHIDQWFSRSRGDPKTQKVVQTRQPTLYEGIDSGGAHDENDVRFLKKRLSMSQPVITAANQSGQKLMKQMTFQH